ncbi:MAG: sigma-54 interaction domain-containing protein, partial [Thermodesulfobacteriota bacterium]
AQDYLAAPLSWEKLSTTLEPYLKNGRHSWQGNAQKAAPHGQDRPVITQDPVMLHILRMAKSVAPTRATVLIQGESGTGKEILARHLHTHSDRGGGPFIAVNCAALPEGLLESELFGHEKGAFTGALVRKLGKFELANNGTLLLDEISEMHPHLQAKLLRVLQENEIDRVGGRHPIPINVRMIATTNQDLTELIQKNEFWEDLYYRLQVISFTLPPLRERRGDIPVLAEQLLARIARDLHHEVRVLSDEAVTKLEEYDWPGNVRELENTLTRAAVLARGGVITAEHLGLESQASAAEEEEEKVPGDTLADAERAQLRRILERTEGNKRQAARILDISRSRLDRLIEKHGVVVPGRGQGSTDS